MEFVILWLLFGVICAVVASLKGRSGVGWFFIGSLLGIFGLIWILVLPSNRQMLEAASVRKGRTKVCPYCAEHIRPEALVCRFCGRGLTGITGSDRSANPKEKL